jgi:hypothetical protein
MPHALRLRLLLPPLLLQCPELVTCLLVKNYLIVTASKATFALAVVSRLLLVLSVAAI